MQIELTYTLNFTDQITSAYSIYSVNRGSNKRVDKIERKNSENSIGTDYSDDDMKDQVYKQRNKDLYKILRRIGVCVIPDPRIKTADHLPYFSIIQEDIREKDRV